MANRESSVGARLLLIGKDGVLAGYKEVTAAVAKMNAEIAAGAKASKAAAVATGEQADAQEALAAKMDLYRVNLAATTAQTDALAKVGKTAFLSLAAAGAVVTYESVKWAKQYQSALVQLRTQAGLTAGAVASIGKAAKMNAAGLGISPTQYVQAAYHPASTGMGVKGTIAVTNAAARLAGIGHATVETTVNAVTGIMKSYGYKPSRANHVAAQVNSIVGAGNMHMATFNAAAATGVFSTGRAYGLSPGQVGTGLAFLTDRGVPAAQAGTHLRMSMALMGAPSAMSAKIQKGLGLTNTQVSGKADVLKMAGVTASQLSGALRSGGLPAALSLLHQHLAGLTKTMVTAGLSRMFGGGKSGTALLQMYQGSGTLAKKTAKIAKDSSAKNFMGDWAKYTKTATYAVAKFDATLKTLGTTFGTDVLPYLTKLVTGLTDVMTWLDKNRGAAKALALTATAILGPAIGVYLVKKFSDASGALGLVFKGYAKVVKAILRQFIPGLAAQDAALTATDTQLAATTAETDSLAAADAKAALVSAEAGAGGIGAGGAAAGLLTKAGVYGAITYGFFKGYQAIGTHIHIGKTALPTYALNHTLGALGRHPTPANPAALTGQSAAHMSLSTLESTINSDAKSSATGRPEVPYDISPGTASQLPARTQRLLSYLASGKNEVHVYIDGKEVKAAVVRQTKKQAARSGS